MGEKKIETRGVKKNSRLLSMASASAIASSILKKYKPRVASVSIPTWYKIPEISSIHFAECCLPIYTNLQGNHESKSSEDPFLKAILMGNCNMTEEQWQVVEEARLKQKVLEMKMGDFHEDLIGKFPGYETLPNGHSTGCDILKTDQTVIIEVKNRHNTMNSSSAKSVLANLKTHKESGKHAILAQINCPNGKVSRYGSTPSEMDIWNGQQLYAFLSGRESFFDDLQLTIQHVFFHYKSFEELKAALEIV